MFRTLSPKPLMGLAAAALMAAVLFLPQAVSAKVIAHKKCMKCHAEIKDQENMVAGDFQSRSNKAKSISVLVGKGKNVIVKFTKDTTVENVPSIKKLKKPIPVQVTYVKKGNDLVATEIVAKPKIEVPKDDAQVMEQAGELGRTIVEQARAS